MAVAFTTLPGDIVLRWHADLSECRHQDCPEYHVSKAELFADLDGADARAHDFDLGKENR